MLQIEIEEKIKELKRELEQFDLSLGILQPRILEIIEELEKLEKEFDKKEKI